MLCHSDNVAPTRIEISNVESPVTARLAAMLAPLAIAALIYAPSATVLWGAWMDYSDLSYTHGPLIAVIVVWLLCRKGRELAYLPTRLCIPACVALLATGIAWEVSFRASVQDLHVTLLPVLMWLAVTAALGWDVGKAILVPMGLLWTAVPSLGNLSSTLQSLTLLAMRGLIWMSGLPASVAGDQITLPEGSFTIEEGCGGLHFLIVGWAVALIHGELRHATFKARVVEFALMSGLALLANWVRVFTLVVDGYYSHMHDYLVAVSHYWFGWEVFVFCALVPFFWLSGRFWGGPRFREKPVTGTAPVTGAWSRMVQEAAVALALLLFMPLTSHVLRATERPRTLSPGFRVDSNSWAVSTVDPGSPWQPSFSGADLRQRASYLGKDGRAIEVFAVAYREQRQGAELVGSGSSVIGTHGLSLQLESVARSPRGPFIEYEVRDSSGHKSVIWARYDIAGRGFINPLASQLWYGLNASVWNPVAALVAFRTECAASCVEAREELTAFVTHFSTPLELGAAAPEQRLASMRQ